MRRLFIPGSESSRTIWKLLTLLVLVIFTLILTDWALGHLLPNITTEPPFILRYENVPGLESLWNFAEADIKPIVFTGSSQIYTGMSPHIFDDRIKTVTGQNVHAVNVSILGSVATIQRDLIRNLIIPNHPQIIIYGIEMRALVPASQDENNIFVSDFKNTAIGYAVSKPSALESGLLLWLLQHSTLVKYRDNIHAWLKGIRSINQIEYVPSKPDDLGYAPFPNTFSQDGTYVRAQFVPFTVTDTTRRLLTDIGKTCKQNGTQCILLNMPLHKLAYQYISPTEELLYRDLLKQAQLPIWDFNTEACRAILVDKDFFNLNHLNSAGAKQFSRMVADMYAKVFFNLPISGDAKCAIETP